MLKRWMKVSRPISPILTLKLVAVARPLSDRKKRVISVIYDPDGENVVKIVQVDLEITGEKSTTKYKK